MHLPVSFSHAKNISSELIPKRAVNILLRLKAIRNNMKSFLYKNITFGYWSQLNVKLEEVLTKIILLSDSKNNDV